MMTENKRATLGASLKDCAMALAEGNPGAMVAIANAGHFTDAMTPGMGHSIVISLLDELQIYGPRIWMLYKDVCGEAADDFVGLLLACSCGDLTAEELNAAIDGVGPKLDIEALKKRIVGNLIHIEAVSLGEASSDQIH